MKNFDLKKFLTENKLTRTSKVLESNYDGEFNELDITYDEFTELENVTDQYLAQKGIDLDMEEEGSGQELADMLNPKQVAKYSTGQDMGAEYVDVYDLGNGYLLGVEDYTGYGTVVKKKVSKLAENSIKIIKTDGREVEFTYNGKPHTVYFDSYEASDYHGNNFSTGYLTGDDQYGGQWAMDAAEEEDNIVDWDIDTIEKIY
jgi:hypothetical protein